MDFGDAAAEGRVVIHLRRHVGEEEQLAVAGARDEGEFFAVVHDFEARVAHAVLAAHLFQVFLPALAVGRIGQHEVELLRGEGVVRKSGMFRPTDDVVGVLALALEEHVGLADRVGLRIDFLAVEVGGDLLLPVSGELLESFLGDGQHSARAARAIVKEVAAGFDAVGDGQEDEVGHEADGVTGRPVFAGFLVIFLVEFADQFFEHSSHRVVVHAGMLHRAIGIEGGIGAEIDLRIEELADERAE